jgi:hypothetical protein
LLIAEKSAANNSALSYLSVGNDATLGKTRSLIKWTPPAIPNADVIAASVGVYSTTLNSANSVELHRLTSSFNPSTVTWTNQPTYNTAIIDSTPIKASGYTYFSVTDLVKGWYSNTFSNNGVLFKYSDSSENLARLGSFK